MEQPSEENPQADEVCKLLKGFYEIKQGNKLWGNRLSTDLIGRGFSPIPTCPYLYLHREKEVILILHVEDGPVCAKSADGMFFKEDNA